MRQVPHLAVATLALVFSNTANAQCGCDYRRPDWNWLRTSSDARGYSIRVTGPEEIRRVLGYSGSERGFLAEGKIPPYRLGLLEPVGSLAEAAGSTVFFWGGSTPVTPLPLAGVWRGADPLPASAHSRRPLVLRCSSLSPASGSLADLTDWKTWRSRCSPTRSMRRLSHCGAKPRSAMSNVRSSPTFLCAITVGRQRSSEWAPTGCRMSRGQSSFRSLVVPSRIRVTDMTSRCGHSSCMLRRARAGLRFDASGAAVWVVRSSLGSRKTSTVTEFGTTSSRTRRTATCRTSWSPARMETIAEVFTSALAVEKNPAGPMRFAVSSMWRRQEGTNQVFRVSPESHEAIRVAAPAGAASRGRPDGAGPRRDPASVGASLVEALGGPERVRIYVLPGGSAPLIEGAEYIQSHGSEVWNWYVNRNPQRMFDASTDGLPLRVLFRYASPKYIERRERERGAKLEDATTPDVPR